MRDGNASLNRLLRLSPEAEPEGYCIAGCGTHLPSLPHRTKVRTICCGDPECQRTYYQLRRAVVREVIADALVDGLARARSSIKRASSTLERGGSR